MAERKKIRNSTVEFQIYQVKKKEHGVEEYYKDKIIWAAQKAIATLFDSDRSVITKHLKSIFESGEQIKD